VTAVVASNHPAGLISKPYVTVSSIPLSATSAGTLVWKSKGKEYYSNRYYNIGFLSYPFSPYDTTTITIIISPSGVVTVKPNNQATTHTFTATCSPTGVMYGSSAPQFLTVVPMYTITFEQGTLPPPPA
jgi:hypothetical protein